MDLYHVIIYAPVADATAIRAAVAAAGAGKLGNYDSCSFSSQGTGRFRPLEHATPHIGEAGGDIEEVEEERIEVVVQEADLKSVLASIKETHPYEEPAIVVTEMVDYKDI